MKFWRAVRYWRARREYRRVTAANRAMVTEIAGSIVPPIYRTRSK